MFLVWLVGVALFGATAADDFAPAHEVVLAESGAPASTADAEQTQLIRRLLQSAKEKSDLAALTIDYPLDGTIVPPEILAPTFLWHDAAPQADAWLVDVTYGPASSHVYLLIAGAAARAGRDRPDGPVLHERDLPADAVSGFGPVVETLGTRVAGDQEVLDGRVGDRDDHGLRQRDTGERGLSGPDDAEHVDRSGGGADLLSRCPVDAATGVGKHDHAAAQGRAAADQVASARHLASREPGHAQRYALVRQLSQLFRGRQATMGMDIDGPRGDKGAYAIADITKDMVISKDEVISWNTFKDKTKKTLGFMSRMSPDGRYAVTTLNELIFVANYRDYKFGQVFYPTAGILAYYSAETGAMEALPGADDPNYVHLNPVWTPDGKTIIFARAGAMDPYPEGRPASTYAGDPNEIQIQYGLYRMPFNEGRGGTPTPIAGASATGMSDSFPKVSPDGKWIVFVKCKTGQLMRPDSELWIVPVEGGEARRMRANMSPMNSWHSFSPNGRWMVFSSKANTPYTQMFLTHIDEQGNDSPAVLIENATAANRAVNLPEFINRPYDEFAGIYVEAVEHYRDFDQGQDLAREGRIREAAAAFEKALEQTSGESRLHVSLSKAYLNLGEYDKAMEQTRKALEINTYNYEMHMNLGFLLARKGETRTALEHLSAATRINPLHPLLWYNRATLYVQLKDYESALSDYTEALELQPRYPDALNGRGMVRRLTGDEQGAMADFDDSIRVNPKGYQPRFFKALMLKDRGEMAQALEQLDAALEVAPPAAPQRARIEALRREVQAALN